MVANGFALYLHELAPKLSKYIQKEIILGIIGPLLWFSKSLKTKNTRDSVEHHSLFSIFKFIERQENWLDREM